jgi:putative membrane protein
VTRHLLASAGIAVLAAAWWGPLATMAAASFTGHMARHLLLVAVAAPLLAWGLAGRRFDPATHQPWLLAAIPASMAEFVVVWAWHAPALHAAAREQSWVLALEQWSFLASGLWLWRSLLDARGRLHPAHAAPGVVALLLTFAHMTLLGAALALGPRPLYAHGAHAASLADQQAGGALMLVVSAAVYLAGALGLTQVLLREPAATGARS